RFVGRASTAPSTPARPLADTCDLKPTMIEPGTAAGLPAACGRCAPPPAAAAASAEARAAARRRRRTGRLRMVSGPSAPPGRSDQLCLSVGPNRRTGIPRASVWQSRGMSTQEERAARFQALHVGAPFVIPNPWDAGSARVLEALGFNALATTRSGFAFTLARLDGNVTLDEVVQHVRSLASAVDLPISVDLENGFGSEPEHAAAAVTRVAEAGAVGGSIEDWDPAGHLYELPHAVERVVAAVEAASGFGWPFTLTARAENHIRRNPDLDDTIARLQAFEAAGGDGLSAPGLQSAPEIRAVCEAVSKPVNVLARRGLWTADIVRGGAQRISVGGSLTWTAVQAFAEAAIAIRDRGSFEGLGDRSLGKDWGGLPAR